MPSYGSGPSVPYTGQIGGIAPAGPLFIESAVTTGYVLSDANQGSSLTINDDTILNIGDEEITGKQLSQMIKAMKIQFPEVFV